MSTDQRGEAWFVAADVCTALAQYPIARALATLKEEEHCLHSEEGPGSEGLTLALINEAGLLRLLLMGDSPMARRMRHWLIHELLPSLERPAGRSREHQQAPEGLQNQTVKELLRLTEEIIELTGVGYADALAAALMDIEANTGLQLAPLQQVLAGSGPAASGHRPRQLGDQPVKARLDAEQLAERLGRTIRDTNRSLAACGLQLRNDEDDWQLTEAGSDWGVTLPLCSRGERLQQILWDPAVVAFLHQSN
ncbi:MAG: Bro-N domain-containing protein [Cyanobacteria bacterium]|nr:Bro-N domain-containing protein [Cyanobacteriota bacterium]